MTATKRAQASVSPGDAGEFDVILSDATEDRDGDVLLPQQWKQPLPAVIQFNADHSGSVSDIVGSGRPWIDENGALRVRGKFATTELGQHIRTLVNEGHLTGVSVEFLKRKDADGNPVHELVGGSFVLIPANPSARVLASKALDDFEDRLDAILAGRLVAKAAADSADGGAMVQAIHDASYHLGAACVETVDSDDGAADGANRATALRLRLKSIRS
jgi:hypothetical protein